ncbi:TorF family putative porin [Roseomonas sp. USHLN139]|uniref:TorF family putative porin n=1 Tax=Roseomonas sp. USHLN139 TaxID=3081298 RepID=UPI003B021F25
MTRLACAAGLAMAAALLAPVAASAQIRVEALGLTLGATPALASDYLFRGLSQTRNRPAAQLTLEALHDSGLYLGAFASNVSFAGSDARQELDLLAGYRFTALDIAWDLGGVLYSYPGYTRPAGGYRFDYAEAVLKASRSFDAVTLLGSVAVSPDYFGQSGLGVYLEGGLDVALPLGLTASGRLGHQWIEREPRFGTPDYATWSASLSRALAAGVTLAIGYYGTDIARGRCAGGQKICDDRVMLVLSRNF